MPPEDYSKLDKSDLLKVIEELEPLKDERTKLLNTVKKLEARKKYGLVWDEERTKEGFEKDAKDALPILKEVKGKGINSNSDEPINILIEGDNYHALSVLNYTHQNKIDIIYIDPPYNTGNKDFKYNDDYVDQDDSYRHSKWLSFINRRLKLARNLLKNNGVIFISIGHDELAQLKLLCDDIFKEKNFITNISRLMKSGGSKGKYFSPNIDYVLVYARDIERLDNFRIALDDEYIDQVYSKKEKKGVRKGERYSEDSIYRPGLDIRPNQRYWIKCPDGSFVIPPGKKFPKKIISGEKIIPDKNDGVWRWIFSKYQKELDNNNIIFKETNQSSLVNEKGKISGWSIYTKIWLSEKLENGRVPTNFVKKFLNLHSSSELKDMGIDFQYAKPRDLIKWLISITNKSNDIKIIDFMAGSGTTGHAVLDLNKEDGGNREFILCTDNESNICTDVCHPRIKKAINGYKNRKGNKVDGLGGNLKYFKTSFIEKPSNKDDLKIRITNECTEMLCLKESIFNKIKSGNNYHLFQEKGRIMGIYYSFDMRELAKLKKEFDKLTGEKVLYCFTFDAYGLDIQDFADWQDVILEPIPQKILDIYE